MTTTPIKFLRTRKEILWVYLVIGNTYAAANTVGITCTHYGIPEELPKLIIVTGVNMGGTIIKDRVLAKMFGNT